VAADSVREDQLQAVLDRLANRDRVRSEATVQSDIRYLLLSGGLGLGEHDLEVELETPVSGGRRIDIEVGFTVLEVKKDLRSTAVVKTPRSNSYYSCCFSVCDRAVAQRG